MLYASNPQPYGSGFSLNVNRNSRARFLFPDLRTPETRAKRHIKPGARASGIYKNIGWHTFRDTFGTLLKANGEDVKTVQELLRHANSRITLEVYPQAVTLESYFSFDDVPMFRRSSVTAFENTVVAASYSEAS